MKTVYRINWDNGNDACGTFPWEFETEERARKYADSIETDNRIEGIWDDDGFCEVISCEEPDDEDYQALDDPRSMGWIDSRGRP